jgi:hypothetical protein
MKKGGGHKITGTQPKVYKTSDDWWQSAYTLVELKKIVS